MNFAGWALGGLLCIPLGAAAYNTITGRTTPTRWVEGVLTCKAMPGGLIVRFIYFGEVLAEMPVHSNSNLNPVVQQLRSLSEMPNGIIVERKLSGNQMVDSTWWMPKENEM